MYLNTINNILTNNSISTDNSNNYPSSLPAKKQQTETSTLNSSFSSLSKNLSNLDSELKGNSNANLGLQDVTKLYSENSAYKLSKVVSLSTNLNLENLQSFFETAHQVKIGNGNSTLSVFLDKSSSIYSNGEEDLSKYLDITKQILNSKTDNSSEEITNEKTLSSFLLKVNDIIQNSPSSASQKNDLNSLFDKIQKSEDLNGINSVLNSFDAMTNNL